MKISDTEMIRAANRNDIIHTLRNYGPLARVDLGSQIGLSPATVTAITAMLQQEQLIIEVSSKTREPSTRGRPRVLIDLNTKARHVLGVKLSINELRLVLGDFKGNIAHQEKFQLNTLSLDEASLIAELGQKIEDFSARHSHDYGPLTAIGIAVQGFVDSVNGTVVWSPALDCRHIEIATPLRERFKVPVFVANDANCIALAIKHQPGLRNVNHMAVIMLDYGVGMSLIMDGRLYLGSFGAAAEFGHTKYSPTGPQCRCGKRGCIEAYVSDYAIYRDARMLLDSHNGDAMHPPEEQMQALVDLAQGGNEKIQQLFREAGTVLGTGIANLLALISPEKVIITGAGVRAYDLMKKSIHQALRDSLVEDLIAHTKIEPIAWQEDLTAKGIIALALTEKPL